jgi:hypothetical protein
MEKNEKCKKSPTGEHTWSEPRFEDSIDRDRGLSIKRYCILCYEIKLENTVLHELKQISEEDAKRLIQQLEDQEKTKEYILRLGPH